MAVYKDLIISTIVDMARFNLNDYVYKDLIISTIVDTSDIPFPLACL